MSPIRSQSAVTPSASALWIRRGAIALAGGTCAGIFAVVLGLAARPQLQPLTPPAPVSRPTIIDGPPTDVEPAPPPVPLTPRLRRRPVDPFADEGEDDLEAASEVPPTQAPQGPWQGQGQAQAQAQESGGPGPDQAPRSAAQAQAAWPDRCAGFSSPADRMVCASPRLNADAMAVQRLYDMDLYQAWDPDALRDEQRRWRAVRDQVAEREGPEGLAELYAERIHELGGPY